MFICDKCHETSKPHEPCNQVVRETRPKVYETTVMKGSGEQKFEKRYTSHGKEIVRVEKLCYKCLSKEVSESMIKMGIGVIKEFDQTKTIQVNPK